MAIYSGSNGSKFGSGISTFYSNSYGNRFIINNRILVSSDNLILKDSKGKYLLEKKENK